MMLLDTSGLYCLHHADEPRLKALFEIAGLKLVHSYVLAEFIALADTRGLHRGSALAFMDDLVDQPDVEVVWVDADLHREGMKLLFARLDKRYSLADTISFVLMGRRGLSEALTTDHHFEQAGFVRLLRP